MPCNFHLRALAKHVKDGIRAAGGTPMEFNTIAISDGITMGTSGMKTSLGQPRGRRRLDRARRARPLVRRRDRACARCDKTIPGTVMALARLDVPGVMLYGGSIPPGHYQGRDITIMDVFEAVGAHAAGKITDQELAEHRGRGQPRRGRLRRPVHGQHDGDGVRDDGHQPDRPEPRPGRRTRPRPTSPSRPASWSWTCSRRGQRPSDLITRESLENAIAAVAATGGSTNGVLHLLAVAREAGVAARHRRLRPDRRIDAAAVRPQARRPVRRHRPARGGRHRGRSPSACKEARPAARGRADRHRQDDRRARRRGRRGAGPGGRPPARQPDQDDRRDRDPARQPRARGLRRQALRPRAPPPPRPRARLRGRGGGDGGRHAPARSTPATSS